MKEIHNLLATPLVAQFLSLGCPLNPRSSLSLGLGKCGLGFGERFI